MVKPSTILLCPTTQQKIFGVPLLSGMDVFLELNTVAQNSNTHQNSKPSCRTVSLEAASYPGHFSLLRRGLGTRLALKLFCRILWTVVYSSDS